jgi:hypothetical protein
MVSWPVGEWLLCLGEPTAVKILAEIPTGEGQVPDSGGFNVCSWDLCRVASYVDFQRAHRRYAAQLLG